MLSLTVRSIQSGIDKDCKNSRFEVAGVIQLDCAGIDGKPFDWRHYGGPLALLRLSHFVRHNLLGDSKEPEKVIPLPERVYYQQGDLILMKVDEIPPDAVPVEGNKLPGGHRIVGRDDE